MIDSKSQKIQIGKYALFYGGVTVKMGLVLEIIKRDGWGEKSIKLKTLDSSIRYRHPSKITMMDDETAFLSIMEN